MRRCGGSRFDSTVVLELTVTSTPGPAKGAQHRVSQPPVPGDWIPSGIAAALELAVRSSKVRSANSALRHSFIVMKPVHASFGLHEVSRPTLFLIRGLRPQISGGISRPTLFLIWGLRPQISGRISKSGFSS